MERDADMRVWTAAEVGRFLEFIWEERLGPLYILAATSGARRGELLGLRWADLDLDATPPVMRIRRTLVQYGTVIAEKEPKTPRSRRTVALDAAAVAALRRHRIAQAEERLIAGPAYTNDDRVFADEIGRPLTPGNVSRGFSRQVKAAGLPQLTLHGLRHTFATLGLEAGVDTLYLSEILGHSSVSITAGIYQHTREERLVGAVQQVGDAIFRRHEAQ